MRMIVTLFAAVLAASCTALPSGGGAASDGRAPAAPAGPVAGLAPQTLASGQCAIFLFERRPPNRFVLFEDLEAGTVQLVHGGEVYQLDVSDARGALVTGERFSRTYRDSARDVTFTLAGEVGAQTGSGPRLENVLLSVLGAEGDRIVRPLAGVRSCGGESD